MGCTHFLFWEELQTEVKYKEVSNGILELMEYPQTQETQTEALYQSRGVNGEGDGRDVGESFKREGIYVYLWLMHVEV